MASIDLTPQDDLWTQLRDELHPERLVSALAAGVVTGTIVIMLSVAFATLIFSGDLTPYVARGIGFMLFGSVVLALLVAPLSSLRPAIANVQDNPAAILALAATAISSATSASAHEKFVTVVAAITVTTIATGIIFWLVGVYGRGNIVRYIPYPVVGGFLAGVGVLLVQGAIAVMADVNVSPTELDAFTRTAHLVKWLPGMAFAVLMLLALRRFSHALLMPGLLVSAILIFYLVLALSGTPIAEAKDAGWLLDSFPATQGGLWQPISPSDWRDVNWSALSGQIGNIAAIVITAVIALLLNATGFELASQQDGDLNRELKVTGISNVIAGLGGGLVGYLALGPSVLAHRIGGNGRLPGIIAAAIMVAVLLLGGSLLAYFPIPVLGGLLFLLGLEFLTTWLYDVRARLPLIDYLIVILIIVVINLVGFLEGIGVGIAVAGVLFVVSYSQIGVIRQTFSGAEFRSSVIRSAAQDQALGERGHLTRIYKLHGFLFFGTANRLLDQIRASLQSPEPPRAIVFDFRMVSGLDSSTVLSFAKLRQLVRAHDTVLCFSHLSDPVARQLGREVFKGSDDPLCHVFLDLDHAVEWCENRILDALHHAGTALHLHTLRDRMADQLGSADYADAFMQYLECMEVNAQHILTRQGDPPRGLFFIESGQITIQLERADAPPLRLRKMSAGTIVGEMGLYLNQPASATVITEQPSTVYHLSPDALAQLEREYPNVATAFHASMVSFMAERLTQTTRTLQTLVD